MSGSYSPAGIDISDLENGIYILQIESQNMRFIKF